MTPAEMKARFQAIADQTLEKAQETVLEQKDYLIGLVLHQQEIAHEDSLGNPLREYSPAYKKYKLLSGKSGETDLEETGEMHGSMNLAVNGDEFTIDSPSLTEQGELKSEWLARWTDAPIMELTEENKELAREYLAPFYLEKVSGIL